MDTIIVSVGRNLAPQKAGPGGAARHGFSDQRILSDRDWAEFKACTSAILVQAGLTIVFGGEGRGYDTTTEATTEESYTVIAITEAFSDCRECQENGFSPDRPHEMVSQRAEVTARLSRLAATFGQDSIALTEGSTKFVSAS